MSGVDLFPDELRGTVPPPCSQEGANDPIIVARFLTRDANWVWYVCEGSPDGDDFIFRIRDRIGRRVGTVRPL